MIVYHSLAEIPAGAFASGTAVAIGKFDGVHRGHHALLSSVAEAAERHGLEPLIFTFTNNPLSLLQPEACPKPLMSKSQRLETFASEGVTACVMVQFDEALAAMPAEEFVEQVLVEALRVKYLCVGEDFKFGYRGAGNAQLLERMGEQFGFTVRIIGDVEDPELGRVSSSRVREAILEGDVRTAGRMLGRPVSLRGTVVHGDARGRELGFPTANLGEELEGLRPADGVYAGWVSVRGQRYQAAISVGANITFGPEGSSRVEAFVLDFNDDIYGETIEVRFADRLRGMAAFATVDALIERMREDVRETRVILAGRE